MKETQNITNADENIDDDILRAIIKDKKAGKIKIFFKNSSSGCKRFFSSLKPAGLKIRLSGILLTFTVAVILITTVVSAIVPIVSGKNMLTKAVESDMYNLAVSYGNLIDTLNAEKGRLSESEYSDLLKDIRVNGYENSCAYVTDSSGTVIYHPDASRIGEKLDNTVIDSVVGTMMVGKVPSPEAVGFIDSDGVYRYNAYFISGYNRNILIITLDEADINSTVSSFRTKIILAGIAMLAVFSGISYGIIRVITKPFRQLIGVSEKISKLDLRSDEISEALEARSDESGDVARSLALIRNEFVKMPDNLNKISTTLHTNALEAGNLAEDVSRECRNNSSTSDTLSAGMERCSSTTAAMSTSIEDIRTKVDEIVELTVQGNKLAEDITGRAEALQASSAESIAKTQNMYGDVRKHSEAAIKNSAAVNKVQELTDTIKSIAAQTRLLSLNASIEAARAGEQGRGFAVVADEIGNLAAQSTDAVNSISAIVSEIKKAVDDMSGCMTEALRFLEETVTNDYTGFSEVGARYLEDARSFDNSMSAIESSSDILKKSISEIVEGIRGINETISEAADGISDVAGKTYDINASMDNITAVISNNLKDAEQLQAIIDTFKI